MSSKPTGTFELLTDVVRPGELMVLEWACGEAICAGFRAELSVACAAASADDLAARLLGRQVALVFHPASGEPAVRRGVVASAALAGGLERDRAELRLVVAPRLDLMRLRITSRIFTDMGTPDILAAIASEWKIACEMRLVRRYDKRSYCTQYRESDLDFLTRICARDGIGFFLEHPPPGDGEDEEPGDEKIVFYDHVRAYAPIAPDGSGFGATLIHHAQRMEPGEQHVVGFRLERSVRPELVRLGDFDFRKPRLNLRARAELPAEAKSPIGNNLSAYLHADRAELEPPGKSGAEIGDALAAVRLEQARRDAELGRGASRCRHLAPGHTFTLDEHPGGSSTNRAWLITRVDHKGKVPEVVGDGSRDEVYSNVFHCVPAEIVYRPPIPPQQPRQTVETATVIGPSGAEIHCDEHGRVQVQFHWELEPDGDGTKRCWLRVSQPWAGTNWGTQFLPRVGAEVIVGFLGGDTDRPVVLGSVYNGTRPWPFRLPQEAQKSGIRSHSSPGGAGHSELVFDDEKGKERVSLRAQRDFNHAVENDYELTIKRGQTVRVEGGSQRTVGGADALTVLGLRTETVELDYDLAVKGSHVLAVSGNSDVRVTGDRVARVEGRDRTELFGDQETVLREDKTERVLGHIVTVVGQHDARRSATLHVEGSAHQYTTGTTELVADKAIVLRSGKSQIRIGPEGIEVTTPKLTLRGDSVVLQGRDEMSLFSKKEVAVVAETVDVIAKKRVVLKGEAAQLRLDKNARIDGDLVKVNCAPDPVDERDAPRYEPPKPTLIALVDEAGKPLAHRRYVIIESDGSERGGMLDSEGKAELFLEGSAEIVFPDVDDPRKK